MALNKKSASPLEIMLQNSINIPSVQKSLEDKNIKANDKANFDKEPYFDKHAVSLNNVLEVDTKDIKVWDLKDYRSRSEKAQRKLDDLVDRIKLYGQTVPCLVKESSNPFSRFELIAGRRRFIAAQRLGIKLKVIVVSVKDDWEALIKQNEENERENPTDYERGHFYQNLIDQGKFASQAEIARFFNKDRQDVSRALTYFKLPKELHEAINDFDNVTASTAEALVSLSSKSAEHLNALISLAESIREGKGHTTIKKLIDNILSDEGDKISDFIPRKVIDSGRHLLTWKKDQNNNISISFPSKISETLPQQDLEKVLIEILNKHLNQKLLSASGQESNKLSAGGQIGANMA